MGLVHRSLVSPCHSFSLSLSLIHDAVILRVPLDPAGAGPRHIALTRRTFVGKVMSLLFNMLSRLVITFLPRSKCPLISWLQLPSAVILESDTVSTVSPSISQEVMGPDAGW